MKLLITIGLFAALAVRAQTYSVCMTFSNIVDGALVTLAQMSNNCIGVRAGHLFVGGRAVTNAANVARPLNNYEVFGDGIVRPVNTVTIGCSNGVTIDLRYAGTNWINTFIDSGSVSASAGFWMRYRGPYTNTINYDLGTLMSSNAGSFANFDFQLDGGGNAVKFVLETTGGGVNQQILGGVTNTWYWVMIGLNVNGSNRIAVADTSLTLLGNKATPTSDTYKFEKMYWYGSNSHPAGQTPNAYVDYGVGILYTGDNCPWPPWPGTNSENRLITTTNVFAITTTNKPSGVQ